MAGVASNVCQSVPGACISRGFGLLAAALAATALAVPQPAVACTCASQAAGVRWPRAGAVDVPVDTPIVVFRYDFSEPGMRGRQPYLLVDADGNGAELAEITSLPPAWEGCCLLYTSPSPRDS